MRGDREPAEVAARLAKGAGAYRHYETGERLPSASDLEVLLNWYGRPERVPFFRDLLDAAKRGTDWWRSMPATPPSWFDLYLGLESAAARISGYDAQVVPGLFQTREYTEAVFRGGAHPWTDSELATVVELRMARQAVLDAPDAPQIWWIIDEAALDRQVGGPEVLAAQLDRLSELAARPNIEIQILSHASGAHAGVEGTFVVLDFPTDGFEGDPGTVYVENLEGGSYYEMPDTIRRYRRVFERLQVQADKPAASAELLRSARKRFS
ncbi:hypothetical protein AFB00_15865 [Pseudonocardia sp. HH130630-07]|nr:hypothetical protein AFB00_15865 [Pseudonocardia sp. HH130630-07]